MKRELKGQKEPPEVFFSDSSRALPYEEGTESQKLGQGAVAHLGSRALPYEEGTESIPACSRYAERLP